jgi:1,4-alpha-glucan branching enzyme
MLYAFHENFVLPLSHDEVVYGKGSLIGKMPGDDWQKFANLRVLYGYMFGHPGKKLLFMGGEFAQWNEWYHETNLDWHLLQYPPHQGIQKLVRDLNAVYAAEKALHEVDFDRHGFEWVDFQDWAISVISFLRRGRTTGDIILVICNFTPVVRENYRIGVPAGGTWREILNTDSELYGGGGVGNKGAAEAVPEPAHGHEFSLALTIPPLGALYLKKKG